MNSVFLRFLFFFTFFFGKSLLFAESSGLVKEHGPAKSSKKSTLQVVRIEGSPTFEQMDDQGRVLPVKKMKMKDSLSGHVIIETDAKSNLDLQNEKIKLRIYPLSKIILPRVQTDDGLFDALEIKQGRLRWESSTDKEILLMSGLFKLKPSAGSFLISYNPLAPSAEMLVFDGHQDFVELNGEQSVQLQANQKVMFLGQIDDGEIAYDKLLKDRMIPKGHKSQVQPASLEDLDKYSPTVEQEQLKKQAELSRKKKKAVPARKGEICRQPGGIFNECAWKCQNELGQETPCRWGVKKIKCYRWRCNANGEWKDSTEIDPGAAERLCTVPVRVGVCDF